jgi:hypothetical protein
LGAAAARADGPGPDDATLLDALYEMRIALEQDRAQRDFELEARTGALAREEAAPGFAEMRREVAADLERMESRYRCLDIDVDVEGNAGQTNLTLVCGNLENGVIQNSNTRANRDLVLGDGGAP